MCNDHVMIDLEHLEKEMYLLLFMIQNTFIYTSISLFRHYLFSVKWCKIISASFYIVSIFIELWKLQQTWNEAFPSQKLLEFLMVQFKCNTFEKNT